MGGFVSAWGCRHCFPGLGEMRTLLGDQIAFSEASRSWEAAILAPCVTKCSKAGDDRPLPRYRTLTCVPSGPIPSLSPSP